MLVRYIKDTRDMLASLNLPKTIPVGNSDAGSFFSTEVLSNVDYGVSFNHVLCVGCSSATGICICFRDRISYPTYMLGLQTRR